MTDQPYVPEVWQCQYYLRWIRTADLDRDFLPAPDDDPAWNRIAEVHADRCDWVESKGHQR